MDIKPHGVDPKSTSGHVTRTSEVEDDMHQSNSDGVEG